MENKTLSYQEIAEQNALVIDRLLQRKNLDDKLQLQLKSVNRQLSQYADAYRYIERNYPESQMKILADIFVPLDLLREMATMLGAQVHNPDIIFKYYWFIEKIGNLSITFRTNNLVEKTTYTEEA
jgi:hypothetical protein